MPRRVPGNGLFRTRQPRKRCVQNVNGLGGGFPRYRAWRHGWGRCRHPRAAGALVAAVGPAAAGAQATQLLRGFVEQDIGVFGHGVLPGTTFMAHGEGIQQVESADSAQIPTGGAVRSRGAHFRRMGHGRLLRKAGPGAAHRPLADQRRPPPRRTAGGRDHGRLRGAPVGTRSESHRTEPADRGRSGDHRRGKLEFTSTRSEPRADITMAIDGMPQVPPGGGARRISPNSWMLNVILAAGVCSPPRCEDGLG